MLGVLWLICSIPIITIGASTTALYYVFMRIIKEEEGYLISDFFRSFRTNFKQSTKVWIIFLLVGIFLVFDIFLMRNQLNIVEMSLFYVFCVLFIFYCAMLTYVFPLISRFDNDLKNLLKSAFLLPIKHLVSTVIMFLSTCGIIYIFLQLLPLIFLLPAVVIFSNSFVFIGIFNKYIE